MCSNTYVNNLNPRLKLLKPYPFERLRLLVAGVTANADYVPINLSIGEPKHPTPQRVRDALTSALDGLASYPATAGSEALRQAIAAWLKRRYNLPALDAATQVLPINGSREALFAMAQTVLDPTVGEHDPSQRPIMICPNPFYQIYEGAALLGGAQPYYVNQAASADFRCDWDAIPADIWRRTQLLLVCTPGNPTGAVIDLAEWTKLFELSDRYGFVIGSDECYSEIYLDENQPPLGALQAASALGRHDFRRLVVFGSLSKRSNCPGMRSGYVAGDAALVKAFLLYRTYHGSAMGGAIQAASIAAWSDEAHVLENRRQYQAKFNALVPPLSQILKTARPQAGFYLWAAVPNGDDERFVRELYRQYNVLLLPGSYLARDTEQGNPARGFVRIALVEPLPACIEGAHRIERFVANGLSASN
jgi:N-succinyldiaminopimelate aminotransferase